MFSTYLQEVCLDVPEDDTEQFLDQAVSFANSCWGSLTCAIFIDPSTQTRHSVAFDVCLENLKFGSIMVNAPTGLAFTATNMSWGAYPGMQAMLHARQKNNLLRSSGRHV